MNFTDFAIQAIHSELSVAAPIIPATMVPCSQTGKFPGIQSPTKSIILLAPYFAFGLVQILFVRSGWFTSTPSSMTATITGRGEVTFFHASCMESCLM